MAKRQPIPTVRRRAAEAEEQKRRIPLWAWIAGGTVVAILLISGLFYLDSQSLRGGVVNPARDIEGARTFPDPGAGHVEGEIDYRSEIPPGGPHNPIWQNCGIYDEPVREENALHSMEHGAVWITYRPDLPEDQIAQLKDLVESERTRLRTFYILSPRENNPAPIVATAWRAQIEVEDVSDEALLDFMQRFHLGPFTPERGASCTGGVGEPS